jgi:SulP family sulfate permease
MAGCGMIGQSVINVQSGGRGRLSTLCAGIFLLFAILALSGWVRQMPMAALVAVMIMVSIGTFRWSSFRDIARIPRNETAVMLTTMLVTIFTRNFALGVATGIVMSTVFFSRKIARLVFVDKVLKDEGNHMIYNVSGQIFFVSVDEFLAAFNFNERVDRITIDLTHAHLWDQGAIAALDKVVNKLRRSGADVEVIGLNQASANLVEKLAIHSQLPSSASPLAGTREPLEKSHSCRPLV